jgi:hypothetical protein
VKVAILLHTKEFNPAANQCGIELKYVRE